MPSTAPHLHQLPPTGSMLFESSLGSPLEGSELGPSPYTQEFPFEWEGSLPRHQQQQQQQQQHRLSSLELHQPYPQHQPFRLPTEPAPPHPLGSEFANFTFAAPSNLPPSSVSSSRSTSQGSITPGSSPSPPLSFSQHRNSTPTSSSCSSISSMSSVTTVASCTSGSMSESPSFAYLPSLSSSPARYVSPLSPSSASNLTLALNLSLNTSDRSPTGGSKQRLQPPPLPAAVPIPPSPLRRGSVPLNHYSPSSNAARRASISNGYLPPYGSSWSTVGSYDMPGSPLRVEASELDEQLEVCEEDETFEMDEDRGRRPPVPGSGARRPSMEAFSTSPSSKLMRSNHQGGPTSKLGGNKQRPAMGGRKMSLPLYPVNQGFDFRPQPSSSATSQNPFTANGSFKPSSFELHSSPLLHSPSHPVNLQQLQRQQRPSLPPSMSARSYFPYQAHYKQPSSSSSLTSPISSRLSLPVSPLAGSHQPSPAASLTPQPAPPAASVAPPTSAPLGIEMLDGHTLNPLFVSRYVISSSLGSGGYGFVCVARELRSNREVAVKFILAEKVPSHAWIVYNGAGEEGDGMPPIGGRIPMECEVLKRVRHWGVVKGEGLYADPKFFYLVSVDRSCLAPFVRD